jgi:hypothetical protein
VFLGSSEWFQVILSVSDSNLFWTRFEALRIFLLSCMSFSEQYRTSSFVVQSCFVQLRMASLCT